MLRITHSTKPISTLAQPINNKSLLHTLSYKLSPLSFPFHLVVLTIDRNLIGLWSIMYLYYAFEILRNYNLVSRSGSNPDKHTCTLARIHTHVSPCVPVNLSITVEQTLPQGSVSLSKFHSCEYCIQLNIDELHW